MALPYHHGHLRLDDSGLLESDFRKGLAQHVAVVKADIGDDAQHRGHDVRAVKTASKACLEDYDISLHLSEPAEGQRRSDLEE